MIGTIPRADQDFTIHDYVPGQPIPSMIRDPKTGKIVVNELKKYVRPFTLTTDPEEVTLAPYETSLPIPMILDSKGHFEVMDAFFYRTQSEAFTVLLSDPGDRPILMNREVHVSTIASGNGVITNNEVLYSDSSAGRPFRWPCSFFMNTRERGRCIFATFRNLSPLENKVRFILHGLRWYHVQAPDHIADKMQMIYRDKQRVYPFFYTTETNVRLLEGQSGDFDVRFTDEAWTEWTKLMRYSSGRFNVRIREKASGKRLMESPIRDDLVFGEGEYPFLKWENDLYSPNYKLTFELTNLASGVNDIWITLGVRKIMWDAKEDRLARPGEAGGMIV